MLSLEVVYFTALSCSFIYLIGLMALQARFKINYLKAMIWRYTIRYSTRHCALVFSALLVTFLLLFVFGHFFVYQLFILFSEVSYEMVHLCWFSWLGYRMFMGLSSNPFSMFCGLILKFNN